MTGVTSSIEAALSMDEVLRSASIMVAEEIEEQRRMSTLRAFQTAMGKQ